MNTIMNQNKKRYQAPYMELIEIETQGIIADSPSYSSSASESSASFENTRMKTESSMDW